MEIVFKIKFLSVFFMSLWQNFVVRSMNKIKVGILGATGMVGQYLVSLLANHPWFELTDLVASSKNVGRKYDDVIQQRWILSDEIPEIVKEIRIKSATDILEGKILFSSLDSAVAGDIEERYAKQGHIICSNSKNHRMREDVPLIIPEVNPEHLSLIEKQNYKGAIITNPNCSTIGLVLALAPIHQRFGIKKVIVTTMQAISGAGITGVSGMQIVDNIIPYISGEEEKVEAETVKILAKVSKRMPSANDGNLEYPDMKISAQCNRVPVRNGHLESVSIELERKASLDEIIISWEEFNPLKEYQLPTAPNPPIKYFHNHYRPQPNRDRNLGKGMTISIGRLRESKVLDYSFVVLSHNTIRGAAGAAILNGELLVKKGILRVTN